MEMPKPTEAHRLFEKMAGSWVGEEIMYPSQHDPAGGTAIGRTSSRITVNGFVLTGDYEQERGGAISFCGHSVWTYEPQSTAYCMYWVDSMGMPGETFRGKLEGEQLAVTSQGPMGHFRLTYDLSTPGQLKSRMEMSQDGMNWTRFFDGVYTKAKPAAPKPAAKLKSKPKPKQAPPKKKPPKAKSVPKKKPPKKAKKRK